MILDSSLEKKVEFSNAIGLLNAHQLQKRFVFDEPTMNSDNLYPPHSSTYTQHAMFLLLFFFFFFQYFKKKKKILTKSIQNKRNVNTLRLQKILQTFSIRNSFQQFIRDNFPIIKVICYSEMLRQNNQRKKFDFLFFFFLNWQLKFLFQYYNK